MPRVCPSPPAAELRHPLCLVLLRNCASPYDQAVTAAVRIFEAILSAQVRSSHACRQGNKLPTSCVAEAWRKTLLSQLWIGAQLLCLALLPAARPELPTHTIPAPAPPWLPQKLRAGLKAELGALYPLLLLKPVEAAAPESAHSVVMAAEGLLHVCSHPQVRSAGHRRVDGVVARSGLAGCPVWHTCCHCTAGLCGFFWEG